MNANIMTAAFWILVGLSFAGIFAVLNYGITSGPNGGAVGAWLVVFPMLFMLGMGVVFQVTSSEALRAMCLTMAGIGFLAVAGIASEVLVIEPMKGRQGAEARVRAETGADIFPEPAQVEFMRAVRDHHVEEAKGLLPAVGDLNKPYGETTLFLFALMPQWWWYENDLEVEELQILEAMLTAGANPNVPAGQPLWVMRMRGVAAVKLLLEAGADVNCAVHDGEPLWWAWFGPSRRIPYLKLALAHGADLQARKDGVGAVARAADVESWESVVLLIEAGAPYKGERAKKEGMMLYDFVKEKLDSNLQSEPPEALVKAVALLAAGKK